MCAYYVDSRMQAVTPSSACVYIYVYICTHKTHTCRGLKVPTSFGCTFEVCEAVA